jgi:membrane protein implicated in regulation of membrane protease activity
MWLCTSTTALRWVNFPEGMFELLKKLGCINTQVQITPVAVPPDMMLRRRSIIALSVSALIGVACLLSPWPWAALIPLIASLISFATMRSARRGTERTFKQAANVSEMQVVTL